MAQPSKKDQIAEAALPLFLELGIKGTSVDQVVKTSGVSKPTVYNHFPDKASLIAHSVNCWLDCQAEPVIAAKTVKELHIELAESWLNQTALRLYGLFLGEKFRAEQAAQLFQRRYDAVWRAELARWAFEQKADAAQLNQQLSAVIFNRLFNERF